MNPHIPLAHGPDHLLVEHLRAVALQAGLHAPQGGREWAELAGLWHDLGKYRPGFQTYIRQDMDAHIEGRGVGQRDKSHFAAGALHALQELKRPFGDRLMFSRCGETAARARDFGAYSVTFDGRAPAVGERIGAAPGVRLIRRC